MKSHEASLLGLYASLLKDVEAYYPRDSIEWRRDSSRLLFIMEHQGSKFFTIDLVLCGKHFDRCLSQGSFSPSNLSNQRQRRGAVIPRLFGGLLLKVFHENGTIRSDVDMTAVSLSRQLYYAAKKVRHNCDPKATFQVVKEFFDVEADCRHPSLDWGGDTLDSPTSPRNHLRDSLDGGMLEKYGQRQLALEDSRSSVAPELSDPLTLDVVQRLADIISCDIGDLTYDEVRPKHGPGAVSDSKGSRSKYSFPHWPKKLELSFPSIEFALPNASFFDEAMERGVLGLSVHEPPSKLIVVPKTQKAPRLIASEPTCHQWIQQALRSFLVEKIEKSILGNSVRFNDQTFSQKGALAASARGHGCTIDLSSASDRLSCWTVERFFRSNLGLLRAFHACRTRWVLNSIDKKLPKYLVLRKFAPMGSALTFPVQSMVYAITSIACTMFVRHGKKLLSMSTRQFRLCAERCARSTIVFGDDIIVPEGSYSLVYEVLSYLGLKVNVDKTFVGGNFYESCGVDAYKGVNVTPTYFLELPVESKPSTIASAIDGSNNFHKGGLWHTAAWLASTLPERVLRTLPIVSVVDGPVGLSSYCGLSLSHLKEKWNENLQQYEYLCAVLKNSAKRYQADGIYSLLQYFTEAPNPTICWVSGEASRSHVTYRVSYRSLQALQPTLGLV